MAVAGFVVAVMGQQRDAARLEDFAGTDLGRQAFHLLGELLVDGAALGGFAAGCGGIGRKFLVQGVQGVNLDDIALHDGTQGAQLLLVLADFGAVGGFRFAQFLNEQGHLLAGRVQLVIDAFVV